MGFLFLTLSLGFFLIFLPFSSEQMVELELPQYLSMSSTMKINCSFNLNSVPIKLVLENGRQQLEASWDIEKQVYVYDSTSRATLEVIQSPLKEGRYSFVFSQQLSCSDFTWYRCRVEPTNSVVVSSNKTLQVVPEITSITISRGFSAQPTVNEISIFVCTATIPKEGSYSVRWFKGSSSSRNELPGGQTVMSRQSSCNRTISKDLRYNVTQSDVPNLILTCQVNAGQMIEKTENFTVLDSTFGNSNKVQIVIPPSAIMSSTMKVKCIFKTAEAILKMVLENGNQELVAFYDFDANDYVLVETDGVNLEVNHDSTRKYGYFTFVFSRLKCSDFTWYRCKADDGVPVFSANKTLQGSTEIELPSYANVSSSMEVHCSFKSAKPLLKMVLETGNREFVASYDFDLKTYVMVESPGVNLKVNISQSKKEGRFTFVFSKLNKNDFTWYRCKAENDINVFSAKKTLQDWETSKTTMAVSIPASLFLSLSLFFFLSI